MRTEAELKRLMQARVEPDAHGEAAVQAVIARLKERKYLDDQAFAETYTRLRQENQKLGARRVRNDLRRRYSRRRSGRGCRCALRRNQRRGFGAPTPGAQEYRKPANEKETARVMRR